jgi:hypothetical protein
MISGLAHPAITGGLVPALPSSILEPLWVQVAALLPDRQVHHPLGCHRPRIPDRLVFDKLIQILVRRRRKGVDCELLAQAARVILRLKRRAHEPGRRSGSRDVESLVRELPRFQRLLVRKLAEKLPLPWDVKLEAIVRGIQVVGIWMCVVEELPLEDCPCLQMMVGAELKERIEQEIRELLEATQRDIERAA